MKSSFYLFFPQTHLWGGGVVWSFFAGSEALVFSSYWICLLFLFLPSVPLMPFYCIPPHIEAIGIPCFLSTDSTLFSMLLLFIPPPFLPLLVSPCPLFAVTKPNISFLLPGFLAAGLISFHSMDESWSWTSVFFFSSSGK